MHINKGNGLTEYLLPSVLLGLVIFSSVLVWMNSGDQSMRVAYQATESKIEGQLNLKPMGVNPVLRTQTFDLGNGKTITLNSFPQDLMALIETEGSNGTTDKLLTSLNELIDKLVAEGQLDPNTEAPLIRDLASKGYRLADNQKKLEELVQFCQGKAADCTYNLIYSSQASPIYKQAFLNTSFFSKIDPNPENIRSGIPLTNQTAAGLNQFFENHLDFIQNEATSTYQGDVRNNLLLGKDIHEFVAAMSNVNQRLNDRPGVQSIISYLSGGIYFNTGLTTSSLNEVFLLQPNQASQQQEVFYQHQMKYLQKYVPNVQEYFNDKLSLKSNQNATEICTQGQGQNHQEQCVPKG